MNLQKFYMGECFDAYEYFGAHVEEEGVVFRTYAPAVQKVSVMMTLNSLYLKYNALWMLDTTYDGFKWVDLHTDNKSVFAYIRTDGKRHFLTILNFSGQNAKIIVDHQKGYLLLDTNWDKFGGNQPVYHKRSLPNTIGSFSGQFYRLRD